MLTGASGAVDESSQMECSMLQIHLSAQIHQRSSLDRMTTYDDELSLRSAATAPNACHIEHWATSTLTPCSFPCQLVWPALN
jgi:hypothetical protein